MDREFTSNKVNVKNMKELEKLLKDDSGKIDNVQLIPVIDLTEEAEQEAEQPDTDDPESTELPPDEKCEMMMKHRRSIYWLVDQPAPKKAKRFN